MNNSKAVDTFDYIVLGFQSSISHSNFELKAKLNCLMCYPMLPMLFIDFLRRNLKFKKETEQIITFAITIFQSLNFR